MTPLDEVPLEADPEDDDDEPEEEEDEGRPDDAEALADPLPLATEVIAVDAVPHRCPPPIP